MCGIFFYLGNKYSSDELISHSNKIQHRGPDNSKHIFLDINNKKDFLQKLLLATTTGLDVQIRNMGSQFGAGR